MSRTRDLLEKKKNGGSAAVAAPPTASRTQQLLAKKGISAGVDRTAPATSANNQIPFRAAPTVRAADYVLGRIKRDAATRDAAQQQQYANLMGYDVQSGEQQLPGVLAERDEAKKGLDAAKAAYDAAVKWPGSDTGRYKAQYEQAKARFDDVNSRAQNLQQDVNSAKYLQTLAEYYKVTQEPEFKTYAEAGAAMGEQTATTPGNSPGNIVRYYRDLGHPRYSEISDDEVTIYDYLLAKDRETGENKAQEYLEFMNQTWINREGLRKAAGIAGRDSWIGRALGYTGLALESGLDRTLQGTVQYFSDDALPTSATQVASQQAQQDLDGFGRLLYSAVENVSAMGPSMALGMINPAIGAGSMFFSSGGNAYKDALDRGYSKEQARTYGNLVGAAEAGLQYALGGISSLGGITDDMLLARVGQIKNTFARVALTGAVHIGSEVTEEELQLFLEPLIASAVFDIPYDAPNAEEMIETMLVTALSTGAISVPGMVNAALDGPGETFVPTAEDVENAAEAGVGNKTVSPRAVSDDIASELVSAGATPEDASRLAPALTSVLNGEEISGNQAGAIAKNEAAVSVLERATGEAIDTDAPLGEVKSTIRELASRRSAQAEQSGAVDTSGVQVPVQGEQEHSVQMEEATSKANAPEVRGLETTSPSAPTFNQRNLQTVNEFSGTLDKAGSKVFKEMYLEGQSADQYIADMMKVYNAGKNGVSLETVSDGLNTATPPQIRAAYAAGQADGGNTQLGKTTEDDALRAKQAVYFGEDAGVVKDDMLRKANLSSKDRRMLDAVGKVAGVKVRFVDKLTDENGRPANAQYKNGELLIALNTADPIRVAFTHEIVHRMREVSPEAYNALAAFVQQNMNSDGVAVVQRAYSDTYGTDPDVLNEEIVAQAFGQMLGDSAVMEQFVKDNRNAAQKLLDAVQDMIAAIKRALNGQNAKLTAGQKADFADLQTNLEEMSKTLEIALKQMEAGVQRNTEDGNKNTASEGGGVKYSFKGYDPDTGRGIYQSNFPLGTPKKEKAARILNFIQNVWSKNPIELVVEENGERRVIQAQFDPDYDESGNRPTDASKLMGGNRHGNASDKRVTLNLADDYYQIASEAVYNGFKNETGKDTPTHKDVTVWRYFINDILYQEYDNEEPVPYRVTVNVKERADGQFVYSFSAERDNGQFVDEVNKQKERPSTRQTLHAAVNQFGKTEEANAQPNNIISVEGTKSNPQNSDSKNSLVVARSKAAESLSRELASIREEGAQTGKDAAEIELEVQQAIKRSYDTLIDEYGAMEPGENPARDVQVPKRTADNQKVSQTVRHKQALDKVRADRDAKLKKLKAEHRAKEAAGREQRKARELRQKIERHVSELSRKLLRPNDKKHIPQALQGPVARLLEAVNLESQYTIDPESGKRQKTPEGLPNKRTKAFAELKAAYAEIKGELVIDPDLLGEDGAVGLLDEVLAMADTPIAAMNSEQLTTLWKAIRAVEASITSTNKLFKASRFKTVGELAQALREDNKGKSAKAEYNYIGGLQKLTGLDMMTPETFLHRLGSAGDTIFRMMRNAQDEHIRIMKETADFTREALAGINVRKLEKELHAVTLGGEEVTLSTAQLMELYALMRREQAQNHIYKGGILPDAVSGKGLKKNIRTEAVQGISEQEVLDALELLTDEQMELAEKLQDYTSNTLGGHGNKASMAVYNYEKFNEEHYWPIRSNRRETHSDVQKDTQVTTVANRGFTKAVKPNANTSVCVGSIFDTFASHASEMATYAAWLEVTEDINRIRNFVFLDKDGNRTGSVKGIIDRVHGSKGSDYLSKLLGDIANGVKSTHGQTEYMGRIVGNYKAAAVGANLRVVIQQPTAILRALDMIDPKYLVRGMKPGDGWKKALKYAPIAQWKDWGYFDINTGRQMKDVLFDSASGWEKARQGAMWLAGKMDSLAWGQLWNACEMEVREQQGKPAGPTWEELTAKDPIKVVELAENTEGLSYAELKARALNRAEEKGWFKQPHRNRDSGMGVFVSEDTFTHAFSNLTARFGEDTILAMERLPEIIEEAVLTHAEGPKDPRKAETQVYTLFAAVRGKNGVEPVKLKVKEYNSDTIGTMPEAVRTWFAQNKKQPTYHRLYDAKVLEVVSIEREVDASASVNVPEGTQAKGTSTSRYSLTGAGAGVKGAKRETDASASVGDHEGPRAKGTPVSEISVADLLDLVNGDARKYIPEPEAGADTEAFYRAVAERFTQIIDHTQVVDGILQRSQIMRDPSALAKMATSFMGEPTKQYNMMMYAVYDAKNGSKEQRSAGRKRLARTVFALAAAGLVNAAAQSIMDAVRDDDDEKEYWEKWMEAFGKNAANMANPAQYIPYVKDVVSVVQGYDVSRMDMESIEKTFGAAKNFIKALGGEGKYSVPGASANLFAEGARLLGIPVANFKRDVISFAKLWAVETDSYLMQYHIQKGALNLNYYDNSGDFMDILYNAYANDRKAYEIIYADMVKSGYDADKIKSGMETRMKKAQGVESVADLKERYLAPEQSKQYEQGRKKLAGSALWKKATVQQRKAAEDDLYEMIAGTDDGERLKEKVSGGAVYGLSESEYLLYRLALSMADEPNDSGGMGTYTNAEVERAIDMVSGLTDAERSYLWLAQGKHPTSNPYD